MKIVKRCIKQILIFLLILLTCSLLWCLKNFGDIGLNEMIFTLNMPLEGVANNSLASYILMAFLPTVLIFLAELIFVYYPYKHRYFLSISAGKCKIRIPFAPLRKSCLFFGILVVVWAGMLIGAADKNFQLFSYVKSQLEKSTLIEENYVNPKEVALEFPEQKRNLICIYLESAETSLQDRENGGIFEQNYITDMTKLAKENVSFSQSDLIEGAAVAPASGWTVAGLVAESAGMPLKLFEYNEAGADNAMGSCQYFLPGATTLGDILEKEGYQNYMMMGSKSSFGGKDAYLKQHGNYTVWDYDSAIKKKKISKDYYVNWGFEDEKLYSFAKEKILELAKEEQPFNFSMLTVDTHSPNGYVCGLCPNTSEQQYANVWLCASKQLNEFVEWAKQQSFYENTTIVVCGDHCSMAVDFFEGYLYDKHNGETVRKVYNAFINSAVQPVKEKNRQFTTMDIFPTVIASLGAKVEGNRLGLGTNLFSEEKTLSEIYGYEVLFDELNKKSSFYNNEILYPK